MAIDNMQGKVTTTGTMDAGPKMPKGKVDPKLPVQKKSYLGNAKKVISGQPHVVKEQVLLHQDVLNVLNMDLILVNQHGFI